MSYPAQIVYVDLQSSKAYSNITGMPMSWPTFVAGGTQSIAVRFLTGDGAGGFVLDTQYQTLLAGLRCGIGVRDYKLESGEYSLRIEEGTTVPIPHSANAKRVQDALNSLVSTNLFTCQQDSNGFYISRDNGGNFNITAVGSTLIPSSFIQFQGQSTNSKVVYKMTFQAAPLAFSTGTDQVLPPAPVATTLQHGGMDAGGASWPTIQNLYIPPIFRGTFQLSDGVYKSELLDITDGASQIQSYINAMYASRGTGYTVTVTNPTSFNVHITFDGKKFEGVDVTPLVVSVYSAPPPDWSILLNLDTIPLQEYLRGANQKTLQFEAEADFYVSRPIPGAPLPATYKKKLWSSQIVVAEPLIRNAFQTAQAIEWLEPPYGKTYVPFTRGQIITGQQFYATSFGDGNATEFVFAHNLNSANLASVLVKENQAPARILKESEYQVRQIDQNSISITFSEAPAINSLAVTVTSSGVTSAFQAHSHTIEQVELLNDRLDNLSQRIAYFENIVPTGSTVISAATTMPDQINVFPSFGEMLPDLSLENSVIPKSGDVTPPSAPSISSQIVSVPKDIKLVPPAAPPITVVPGTDLLQKTQEAQAELAKIQAQIDAAKAAATKVAEDTKAQATEQAQTKASRNKTLITRFTTPDVGTKTNAILWPPVRNGKYSRLPSARQSAPITASSAPSVGTPAVYSASGGFQLPGLIPGRKGFSVTSGDHFASDGVMFYKVQNAGGNLWYPSEMDRELSRVFISNAAFPDGSTLNASFDITTFINSAGWITSPDVSIGQRGGQMNGAEYRLVIQAIPLDGDMNPGSVGTILNTVLGFSVAYEQRVISITAKRDGSSSSAIVYGKTINGDAIPDGDLSLRVFLTQFDVDSTQLPVGQIGLWMPSTQITITNE